MLCQFTNFRRRNWAGARCWPPVAALATLVGQVMVDVDEAEGPHHFRFALTKGRTAAAQALVEKHPSQTRIAQAAPLLPTGH